MKGQAAQAHTSERDEVDVEGRLDTTEHAAARRIRNRGGCATGCSLVSEMRWGPACNREYELQAPRRSPRKLGRNHAGMHNMGVALLIAMAVQYSFPDSVNAEAMWSSGSSIGVQCDMLLPPFDFQFEQGYERCPETR